MSWPRVTPGLVEGLLVLAKLFSFPRFLRHFLFKTLVLFLWVTFSKFKSSVFIAPNPSASSVLYYCDFCAQPLDFSVSLSFSGTPFCFSCSFFPFEVLFASFFYTLFLF